MTILLEAMRLVANGGQDAMKRWLIQKRGHLGISGFPTAMLMNRVAEVALIIHRRGSVEKEVAAAFHGGA
jgi:hypothetical protein